MTKNITRMLNRRQARGKKLPHLPLLKSFRERVEIAREKEYQTSDALWAAEDLPADAPGIDQTMDTAIRNYDRACHERAKAEQDWTLVQHHYLA